MSQSTTAPIPTIEIPSIPLAELAPWAHLAGLLGVRVLFFVGADQGAIPLPAGPANITASPTGIPPPVIASRPGTPVESRDVGPDFARGTAIACGIRGNPCKPPPVPRNVCAPGQRTRPGHHQPGAGSG